MADTLVDDGVSNPTYGREKEIQKPFKKKLKIFDEDFKLAREASSGSNRICEALDPPKEVIKTKLYMHQKLGLSWLIQRENSDELPPFWIQRGSNNKQGGLHWENLMTNSRTNKRPDPLRGGVFADDIGLGKTLTLLSLIATDYSKQFGIQKIEEEEDEEIDLSLSLSVGGSRKRMKPSKETTAASSKKLRTSIDNAGDTSSYLIRRRTTLIICRPAVLLKWETQLDEHTEPGTLKVFTYHGEVEDLMRYDIVLTTYSRLMGAFRYAPAMWNMEWFRVILDEAHMIRSVHDNISNVFSLKAKNRWLVTGMPILSGAYNMHFSMAFLRSFEPYSNKNNWKTLVQLPIQKGKENALSRLQDIMSTVSLRRLNSDPLVGVLPPKAIETCFVELSVGERDQYDQMELDYQCVVRNYLHLGREVAHYTSILGIVQRLRQMCNEAASCPSEPHRSYTIEDVSKNPELLRKMVSVLQDVDSFDCPICISPLVEPIITCCAHMFCKNCILKALLKKKSCCPLCRHDLSEADLFSASSKKPCNEDENNIDIISSGVLANCSSKVSTLLNLLVSSRNENHLAKSVVFSQFENMLSLLEKPLKAAGFEILKLNGRMSSERRNDLIKIFKNWDSNSSIVLLVDLKALGSGVHLTTVSNAYLLEPWINPATEEQVLNRVHGLVRKEVVKIVRLITRRSIEERIMELHEKKKLGRLGNNMDQREARYEELRLLMAL
ncbi:hypothetical protein MKX01_020730 [Papaver californicum]|nr:hypothetical protein MKX01_020730 [Papaver californicum]